MGTETGRIVALWEFDNQNPYRATLGDFDAAWFLWVR